MIVAFVGSSLLLLISLCAVLLLRRQSAAARHAVLAAGLISSLIVPFLGNILPDLRFAPARDLHVFVEETTEVLWSLDPAGPPLPGEPPLPVDRTSGLFRRIWIVGIVIAASVLITGSTRVAWLGMRSRPLANSRWTSAAREISRRVGLRRPIRLLQSDRVVLGTYGVFRPKIFVPRDAEDWPLDRIRLVLTHELAHIKRLDWPVQVLAEISRVVYWFNPLCWLACRWLTSESEHACDDVVLNAGFDGKEYATQLLDLARTMKNSNRTWSPVLAMSRPLNLERRFVAMLNPALNHRSITRKTVFVICALASCVTLPLAAAMRAPEEKIGMVVSPPSVSPAITPTISSTLAAEPIVRVARRTAPKASRVVGTPLPALRTQGRADGSLAGTVSDSTGAVVPGVRLTASTLERLDNGIRESPVATAVTDEAGRFLFSALTPGEYSLKAELPGFSSFRRPGIAISPSQTTRQNVQLSVGGISQRVEVTAAGQPRQPVPLAAPQRIRVGGYVVAANLISQVKPIYPLNVREAGIEGSVQLQGIIGIEGSFITLRVVSSNHPDLAAAALEAVRQWRYRPTLLNNQPTEVQTEIVVDFKLAQ